MRLAPALVGLLLLGVAQASLVTLEVEDNRDFNGLQGETIYLVEDVQSSQPRVVGVMQHYEGEGDEAMQAMNDVMDNFLVGSSFRRSSYRQSVQQWMDQQFEMLDTLQSLLFGPTCPRMRQQMLTSSLYGGSARPLYAMPRAMMMPDVMPEGAMPMSEDDMAVEEPMPLPRSMADGTTFITATMADTGEEEADENGEGQTLALQARYGEGEFEEEEEEDEGEDDEEAYEEEYYYDDDEAEEGEMEEPMADSIIPLLFRSLLPLLRLQLPAGRPSVDEAPEDWDSRSEPGSLPAAYYPVQDGQEDPYARLMAEGAAQNAWYPSYPHVDTPADTPWVLQYDDGSWNAGLLVFLVLCVACAGVWTALLLMYCAYRRAACSREQFLKRTASGEDTLLEPEYAGPLDTGRVYYLPIGDLAANDAPIKAYAPPKM